MGLQAVYMVTFLVKIIEPMNLGALWRYYIDIIISRPNQYSILSKDF